MNTEEFVEIINLVVCNSTADDVISNLESPPGRQPDRELKELSVWFNSLDENAKVVVNQLIKMTSREAVKGFLCVLDGVRAIENQANKGQLELWYKRGEMKVNLNDPNGEMLHDLLS